MHFSFPMWSCPHQKRRQFHISALPQLLSSCHGMHMDHQGLKDLQSHSPTPHLTFPPLLPLPSLHHTFSLSSILSLLSKECWASTVEAKLFSTSSIFICQAAVAAAAWAELQGLVCVACLNVCGGHACKWIWLYLYTHKPLLMCYSLCVCTWL